MRRQSFLCSNDWQTVYLNFIELTEVILKALNKGNTCSRLKIGIFHNENIFLKKKSLTMHNTRFVKVQHACGL
jgi:hypothetical protein